MILFLDIEHPSSLDDAKYREERAGTMEQRRQLFEELSGMSCRVRHYSEFRAEEIQASEVEALVTSGNRALWDNYDIRSDFSEFSKVLHQTRKPVLGICGGHQLIGLLSGGEAEELPENRREYGFFGVSLSDDPLFQGFQTEITVNQSHFWHVSRLPQQFRAIARNANCPVQAMRHCERQIYGVQFHPEFYDRSHLDGRTVLANFFSLARST